MRKESGPALLLSRTARPHLTSPASPLLGIRLRQIGFTPKAYSDISSRHAAVCGDPLALAVRLFRDALPVSPAEAGDLFGTDAPLACLAQDRSTGQLTSPHRLEPIDDLFIWSDWPTGDSAEVLPPGETTAILAHALDPAWRYLGRVLDIGCGSGTLGLLLSGRSTQVVATDINSRALALAADNASLNAVTNISFRQGSLFAPLRGETFDLIVSQPPFIPQPPETAPHTFLHGGTRGDELARQLLAGLASHLTPDGHALIFSDWPLQSGQRLADRLPSSQLHVDAFAGPPICPESYAEVYGHELLSHFRALGIVGVQQTLLHLHHGSGFQFVEVLPHEWRSLRISSQ